VFHRIKVGWLQWKTVFGVLCDHRIPMRLKGKFHKKDMRPDRLYVHNVGLLRNMFKKWVAKMKMLTIC